MTDVIIVGGLMVMLAVFELAKELPRESVPLIDTLYAVGLATFGPTTWKVTRRVLEKSVVTVETVAVSAGPVVTGVNVTVIWAGAMAPLGKFEPVRLTNVTPGCAALGVVVEASVTKVGATVAARNTSASPAPESNTIRNSRRNK